VSVEATDHHRSRVLEASARLSRCQRAHHDATHSLDAEVLAWHEAGATFREIGEALGVPRQRVDERVQRGRRAREAG
jgi:DNA-directed RNA polymerase specialized sigma24 family protein